MDSKQYQNYWIPTVCTVLTETTQDISESFEELVVVEGLVSSLLMFLHIRHDFTADQRCGAIFSYLLGSYRLQ